jgi:hypothetical protein
MVTVTVYAAQTPRRDGEAYARLTTPLGLRIGLSLDLTASVRLAAWSWRSVAGSVLASRHDP